VTLFACCDFISALPLPDAGALDDSAVVERRMIWDQMLVAATGSADCAAYIFDAGASRGEQGDFIQKLDGHKNRVYSAMFHPAQVCFVSEQLKFCFLQMFSIMAPAFSESVCFRASY
jgi:hypothetical protein